MRNSFPDVAADPLSIIDAVAPKLLAIAPAQARKPRQIDPTLAG